MAQVLLIEDDPSIRRGLGMALGRHGHQVRSAETGEEGLRQSRDARPEVVVLDLMLPGIDGFEVCRRLRADSHVPIIMLTAKGDDFDVVGGLEAGADDYVVKPVLPRVLDARIRAVLRRGAPEPRRTETHAGLTIDRSGMTVTKDGDPVSLTPTELRVLLELSRSPGQVLSRRQLLQSVWEHDYLGDSRLVDNCVQRLRAKIESDPTSPVFVQTVRGFGYRFGPV
ncbi:response regulator transcription factor [Amycolatopsis cihanbeyliensis]|uniref:DNA-binding response OmpR family regulator n=1 Tax=Amycolatopsis cihanbeyliensis TaxID=1128664 RepID=A0A542DFA4_AMYCI|nr:response regulator transcription factor [Amycolatopsis cihanbeyliensis]TQJ01767.1 DNA-binding response OmpR family regulator [Amycolatopsis cihanbeyliensis]